MFEQLSFGPFAVFLAGILSVISPCILPLIPPILAYSADSGKYRPVAIVIGLSISFIAMGILSSAFGSLLAGYIDYLRIAASLIILVLGISLLVENFHLFNIFSRLPFQVTGKGGVSGALILGISLGILWIPCTGPILGAILTMVAVEGNIFNGIAILSIYSLGFSIPVLVIAYSANITSAKLGKITHLTRHLKMAAGIVLIAVGLWMMSAYLF
ncbi:cytochrome c biogenesis protein transmembrane region [Methanosalsum zhilinae DSM 4017]|uniref:Cytochrome c biogenesis protein transmembrane region n=1 Tax=Methanosalsum zhilinae (strain DSM 4017 / NBRC 107636 / OCM 62 / WeN5) TaxID=679901 RepID=F7XNA6_METZD|nr:cytochrome c biogenesis CcdA family protein [Methanosalsum zhilinae]AEH60064.1 cytochrome c biogenesis protein transmembrane region [Methanosalsum zhilinae DSM 4017]